MVPQNSVVRNFSKLEGLHFAKTIQSRSLSSVRSCQPFLEDIWAMMVTLYVIIFRRYPFLNPDEIKRCRLDVKFLRSRVSEELEDLFRSTLIGQPYHRLTIHEIENHEWTQQPFSQELYSWNVVTQNSLGKKGNVGIKLLLLIFRRNIPHGKSFSKWWR